MNNTAPPAGRPPDERVILWAGSCTAWALLLLMAIIVLQVILRYVFNLPIVALSELQRHLYALLVMTAISYAGAENAHVRVDLFHDRLSQRTKDTLTVIGQWLLVIPLVSLILFDSVRFTHESYRIGETSLAPGGLPFKWIVKSLIPIGSTLIIAGAVGEGWRALRRVLGKS